MQKMCAEVDAHNKLITFNTILVKSSTNSDVRPANHNVRDGMCDWAFNNYIIETCYNIGEFVTTHNYREAFIIMR